MTAKGPWKAVRVPVWGAAFGGLTFVVLLWLFRTQAWPGVFVAVVGTFLVGVVGRMLWIGHLDSEDERLLRILITQPGMTSDQFRASSGLGPDEYALAVHRLKDGWWIEWQWGAYRLTARAKSHLEAKGRSTQPRPGASR